MHGHSYTVEVEMEGILDPRGFVIDYAEIDLIMTPIIGQLDHRNIDIVMNPTPSTAEYLAIWFYARVQDAIMRKGAVHLNDALVIRIWETGKTRVEYAG
jgi:6-pyruvoyltetrahydropterin/6-carboxytetrahydropterin synthase